MTRIVVALVLGLTVSGLVVGAASSARADSSYLEDNVSKADRDRLERFEAARTAGLAEARAGGAPADLAVLDQVLAGKPQSLREGDIRGKYRCRTIKLGGQPPLTIYGWFDCVLGEDDLGYRLDKTTGSQRFSGHFIDDTDTSMIFWGANHVQGEKPRRYGADADQNSVGRLVKLGPKRLRLELPWPTFESKFDIIELVKP